MTLFERVKETAKNHNLNVKQTALKAGLGENSIYKWKNSTPSTEAVQKVADVLNVSVDYLINGDTKPAKSESISKGVELLAAHIDDDVTDEELEDIANFIDFIKNKKKK